MPTPDDRARTFRAAVRAFPPFETAIRREWASFRDAGGGKLQLEAVSMDHHPLYEALFEKKGLLGGDWDVAFVNTDWLARAHATGALVDLAAQIHRNPPEDFPAGWTDSLLRLQRFGEVILGLPYHDGPECLIYRKDLLEDAGLKQVPETWDDFARAAKRLSRREQNLYGTVFAAYPDGHNTVYDICLQLWTRGGELFDDAGRMRLNTPEMLRALEFYRRMLNDGQAMHPECRRLDSVKAGEAFLRGEVAMMINWFGFAAVGETSEQSKVAGRVAIGPIPHDKESSSASLNCYWLLGVPAGSPHKNLAYRLLRHCMSRFNDKQRTLEGVIGCRKSTWTDAEVNRRIPFYRQMETLHAAARELPRLTGWVELSAVIDRMVLETINTKRPIGSIAAEAQKRVDALQGAR